jgi:CubicO group peptidase (beta-lactamase class C family)
MSADQTTATETAANTDADAIFAELGQRVTAGMERLRVPGVAVGVLYDGHEYTAGFGVTSLENPLPVTDTTLFQIGSTSKTVTATAAMRLVEQGTLALDTPVRAYLPDLRLRDESVAARVTLKHLFTHTGGWVGDYFDDTGWGDDALAKIVAKMADLPQMMPLGEVWSYNNSGFYIAGRVIEAVTGKPFEAAIHELVLAPLGMNQSLFFAHDVITQRFAVGHQLRDDQVVVARPWALPRTAHPAGGISSTVRDQLAYARFSMGDGTASDGARLLALETMRLMQSPQAPAGGKTEAIGITWMLRHAGGVRIVEHGGATNGQLSAFTMAPDRGFAITILTNADRGGQLHSDLVKWALARYLGASDPEPEHLPLSPDQLAVYAGRYTGALGDLDLTVRDGDLILQDIPKPGFPTPDAPPSPPDPPSRLAFLAPDRVIALDEPMRDARGEFARAPDGSIAWFRFGSRVHPRQQHVTNP